MPPGPIEGSCLPSPTAMSFAPERSTSSVSASRRAWSTIPASSRIHLVSWLDRTMPVFARATSASRVSVRPSSAGLSAPRRSAVEPGHGDADRLAAGVAARRGQRRRSRRPCPVPAGPTSTARRSGPVSTSQRLRLLGAERCADALGDFARRASCVFARRRLGRQAGRARCAALDRLLLGAHGERSHPPALKGEDSPVADHLSRDGERLLGRHLPGGLLQRDRVQLARLEHGVLLCEPRLDPVLDRPLATFGARARQAAARPRRGRSRGGGPSRSTRC